MTLDEQLRRAWEALQHVTVAVEASIAHDDGGEVLAAAEKEALHSLAGLDRRLQALTTMAIVALRGDLLAEHDDALDE